MPTEVSLSESSRQADASVPPAGAPEVSTRKDESEISILDLLIVIAQRKRRVLAITAGFAVLAVIVSLLLPLRYTATVTILPPQQNSMSSMLTSQLGNLGGMAALAGGALGVKSPNDMYVSMLKSRTVEDAMVERYGLMQEYHDKFQSFARKDFEEHATVDGAGKDGLIRVSVSDKDPNRAAELANGYIDQFRKLSEHLAIGEAGQRRLFFEQQLEQAKNNLADAEEALKRTEQKTGLIELDSQARALIESAAALRAQITAKEVQIKSLETFATDQNAQLVQAQQELAALRAQLAQLGGSETDPDAGIVVPKGQVPEAGLEYVRKLRDVKYYETIFEILARQFEMAKLDEAREGALIQVVDPAIPPDRRSFPKRGYIVMGATAAGFLIGLIFVVMQASFEKMQSDPETRQKLTFLRRSLRVRNRTMPLKD
jgi:uncharacterized protein involved in exopolysaccharide biosynthesis